MRRIDQINEKWGNYKTETTKGMQELCSDFEWLTDRVEECEGAFEEIRKQTNDPVIIKIIGEIMKKG